MYNKIHRANIASGGTTGQLKVTSQEVDGLLFFGKAAQIGNGLLTVVLRPDGKNPNEKPETLVNRINLLAFAEMSDINQGCSFGLNTILNAIAAGLTAPQTIQSKIGFYVALGKLDLDGGDSLEITLEATGGAMDDLGIYAVDRADDKRERMIKYEEIASMNEVIGDPMALYAWRLTAATNDLLMDDDLVIGLTVGGKQFSTEAQAAWAGTVAFGQVEGQAVHRLLEIYEDCDEGLNGSISYNMTGANKANYSMIAVTEIFQPARIARKGIQIGQKAIDRIRQVELKNPEKARAMRHLGRVSKSQDLQKQIDHVSKLNKKPAGSGA